MPIGFGGSYQYAGINRIGRYREAAREKGPVSCGRGEGETRGRGDLPNEVWRRVTGIFPHVCVSNEERRAGIARLVKWIEERVALDQTRRHEDAKARRGLDWDCGFDGEAGAVNSAGNGDSRECATGGLATSANGRKGLSEFEFSSEQGAVARVANPDASGLGVAHDFSNGLDTQGVGARAAKGEQRLPVAHTETLVDEPPVAQGIRGGARVPHKLVPDKLSLAEDWEFAADEWACVRMAGASVEGICVELGLTHVQLTSLLKEYCGLSSSEFLDGLKIGRLKEALTEKLKVAAEVLWGFPGSFVAVKLEGVDGTPSSRGGAFGTRSKCFAGQAMSKVAGRGRPAHRFSDGRRSKYFQMRPEDFFYESRFEERARRVAELCEVLNDPRGRTASQSRCIGTACGTRSTLRISDCGLRIGDGMRDRAGLFDAESFALSAGFSSAARLKRACLNVLGKSLRAVECELAEEVVQFYLCAEDRELREIASRENEIAIVFRARELYHRSEEAPTEPFLDEWSKFEMLKPEWLSRMRDMFAI